MVQVVTRGTLSLSAGTTNSRGYPRQSEEWNGTQVADTERGENTEKRSRKVAGKRSRSTQKFAESQ